MTILNYFFKNISQNDCFSIFHTLANLDVVEHF